LGFGGGGVQGLDFGSEGVQDLGVGVWVGPSSHPPPSPPPIPSCSKLTMHEHAMHSIGLG